MLLALLHIILQSKFNFMSNLARFSLSLFLLISQLTAYAQAPDALWANRIGDGPGGLDRIIDLEKDADGNTYVVGWFRKSLDVDPGPELALVTSTGLGDQIWFAKYDSNNNLLWVNSIGNSSSENANALTVDDQGNVYLTGYFVNTVDFDPSDAVFELTTFSASNSDAFFAKYTTNGDFLWAKQLGGLSTDNGQDIKLDNEGNILITGNFSDVGDLDPSENEALFTTSGFNDIFIAKYTNDGDYIWAFSLEGSTLPDNGQCLAIQDDNSIVLGAIFQRDIDADPGSESVILENANGYDVLIGTYSSTGDLIWAGSIGSNGSDQIYEIDLDSDGNIYAAGSFSFTVDFDFSENIAEATSSGSSDAFIVSYTSDGDLRWYNTIGASSVDEAIGVCVDENDLIYLTGRFNGEVDFNPGVEIDLLTGLSTDVFFASYTSEGEYNFAKNFGGTGFDVGNVIFAQNSILTIGGLFALVADFDPSTNIVERIGDNQTSFFAEYSALNGDFVNVAAMEDRNGGDDWAWDIEVDSEGFAYVCGSFEGNPLFGATNSGFNSNGDADAYLAKFSPSGDLVWAKQFGDTEADAARGLAISDDGFVYVVGEFEGIMEVNTGNGNETLASAGNRDAFIIKYDLNGNYIWSVAIGGGADDAAFAIALDPSGNPFICGQFRGLANFDPLGAGFELTPNNNDIFIAGYSANDASLIWAKQINGPSNEFGRTISFDSNGNVVAGGIFAGTIDVDPGPDNLQVTSNGSNDGLLVKLDPQGNYIWHIQLGGSSSDAITAASFDDENNLYVSGHFNDVLDADMNSGETLLTSNGGNDIMIIKYLDEIDPTDSAPILDWAYSFGNESDNYAFNIHSANNSIYLTGGSRGEISFDYTGAANPSAYSGVNDDIYLAKLSSSGDYQYAFYIPGDRGQEYGYSIATDGDDVFLVGAFDGNIDVQPGNQENLLSPIGDRDGFIIKYGASEPCENSSSSLSEIVCSSFILNETTYDVSGEFTQIISNAAGCDSIITLNLTVLNPTESVINESSCDVFTLNGTEYDASGSYTQIVQNSVGCDSTITLVLDINPINPTVNQAGSLLTAEDEVAEFQWYDCVNMVIIDGEVSQSFEVTTEGSFAVILNNGACIDTSECFEFETVDLDFVGTAIGFEVFPNPSNGLFFIKNLENNSRIQIYVYSVQGELLVEDLIEANGGKIDLTNLTKGVYLMRLANNNETSTKRLIIN